MRLECVFQSTAFLRVFVYSERGANRRLKGHLDNISAQIRTTIIAAGGMERFGLL
jgi:hypothetical protein